MPVLPSLPILANEGTGHLLFFYAVVVSHENSEFFFLETKLTETRPLGRGFCLVFRCGGFAVPLKRHKPEFAPLLKWRGERCHIMNTGNTTGGGRSRRILILGGVFLACPLFALEFPPVNSLAELETEAEAVYADTNAAALLPPPMEWSKSLGYFVAESSFDTNFLSSLIPIPSLGAQVFPVEVMETTSASRERIWINATGGVVHTELLSYDPVAWVESAFGSPPAYVTNTAAWYAERDRSRLGLMLNLILPADLPTISNHFNQVVAHTGIGSNSPFEVSLIERAPGGGIDLYVNPPSGGEAVDIYQVPGLVPPVPWSLLTTLSGTNVPLHYFHPAIEEEAILLSGDAFLYDSDKDGIFDSREQALHHTNPNLSDTDGDGLKDWDEIFIYGTDANNADSDGDGMPDSEALLGLDPHNGGGDDGADADPDGDGLRNRSEVAVGSNPFNPDTDGDGINDLDEVRFALNPVDDGTLFPETGPNGDIDGNGISNKDDINAGSDPVDPLPTCDEIDWSSLLPIQLNAPPAPDCGGLTNFTAIFVTNGPIADCGCVYGYEIIHGPEIPFTDIVRGLHVLNIVGLDDDNDNGIFECSQTETGDSEGNPDLIISSPGVIALAADYRPEVVEGIAQTGRGPASFLSLHTLSQYERVAANVSTFGPQDPEEVFQLSVNTFSKLSNRVVGHHERGRWLIPVNDDNDEEGPVGQKDNRDNKIDDKDNDITALTTLPQVMNAGSMEGEFRLSWSPEEKVQVYRRWGKSEIQPGYVISATPSEPPHYTNTHFLIEGMEAHSNVTFRIELYETGPEASTNAVCYKEVFAAVLKPEILDGTGSPTGELHISKWPNAFSGNPSSFDPEFINTDPDRFQIRVTGFPFEENVISAFISTEHETSTTWDDDETEVHLYRSTSDSSVYTSKVMILVSNVIDDRETHNGVDGAISMSPDNSLNDRTHIARLNSEVNVRIEAPSGGEVKVNAKVPQGKTVDINVKVLNDGGVPIILGDDVTPFFTIARETYWQAGIELNFNFGNVFQNPPGVDMGDGLTVVDPARTPSLQTQESQTIIDDLGTGNDESDIHIFYIRGPFKPNEGAFPDQIRGLTLLEPFQAGPGYKFNALIVAGPPGAQNLYTPWTLPHELTHLLGIVGHKTGQPWSLRNDGTVTSNADISDSKRLDEAEEAIFHASPHAN